MSLEPWLMPHLQSLRGQLALDVGANVGSYARWLAGRFDEVHAFEPHPAAATELRQAGPKVHVTEAAVGDQAGMLTMKLYGHSTHTSAFEDRDLDTLTRGSSTGAFDVPVVTLDGLGYDRQPVGFMKVDTEGYETHVLTGARETLRANMPPLLVEIHAAQTGVECAEMLTGLGYTLLQIPHPHSGVPPGHHWLYAPRPGEEQQ